GRSGGDRAAGRIGSRRRSDPGSGRIQHRDDLHGHAAVPPLVTTAAAPTLEERDYRPSYRAAALASALIFVLYLATLAPSTAMWDTSEYIAAAYTLGLPHPPGNPFFVLLGRFFALL